MQICHRNHNRICLPLYNFLKVTKKDKIQDSLQVLINPIITTKSVHNVVKNLQNISLIRDNDNWNAHLNALFPGAFHIAHVSVHSKLPSNFCSGLGNNIK